MTPGSRAAIAWSAIALGFAAPAARAQSAGAELLFREGRDLIKHGKLAAGCGKLEASDRLEPSVGTLLNLGDCREKLGQLATAWAAFRRAEAIAHRDGKDRRREAEARRRAARLEGQLPKLEIDVSHPIDDLVVRRDGEVVDPATFGTPLPVDPGMHAIVATAAGHLPWKKTLNIDGRRAQVTVPALDRAPAVQPAVARVASSDQPVDLLVPPAPPASDRPPPPPRSPSRWTAPRELSVGLAIGGAGALATGIYFGLRSRDLRDQADERCPAATCSDPQGLELNADARTAATRANILYAAGGTAVLASLVLCVVGSPGDDAVVTPAIGDHHASLSYARRF